MANGRDDALTTRPAGTSLTGTVRVGAEDRMHVRRGVPRYHFDREGSYAGVIEPDALQTSRMTYGAFGARIVLKTPVERLEMYLGPAWFLREHDVRLTVGDPVTVTGSQIPHRALDILMAREISLCRTTVKWRDRAEPRRAGGKRSRR